MKKLFLYVSCLLLLGFLFTCCSASKKILKSRTITETIIKIDTIIKIKTDTVLKHQEVVIHDTAEIENNYSAAKAYYSVTKQRIVLELKGKNFDVPVTVYKKVTTDTTTKQKEVKPNKTIEYILKGLLVVTNLYILFRVIQITKK